MMIGYSYWGFLADIKMNSDYEEISTPDGNAFYSWSIINELQKHHDVCTIMPDRDKYAVEKLGKDAFSAWITDTRYNLYNKLYHIEYTERWSPDELFKIWDSAGVNKFDFILHEWRMPINGRNNLIAFNDPNFQPDLFIQNCLLDYCNLNNIKLILFDLDYKLPEMYDKYKIIELGNKHGSRVYIPFDFDYINEFDINPIADRKMNLIYVGNRYERDWCIDKYIPKNLSDCVVYGNWTEAGRDSKDIWPTITFGHRLQLKEMQSIYSNAVCTVLLAKEEYCKYNFMTARLLEAVFYGTIPLFIEEYGTDTIKEFSGKYHNILTVSSADDVVNRIQYFREHPDEYINILQYLRVYLSKMDVRNFVNILNEV